MMGLKGLRTACPSFRSDPKNLCLDMPVMNQSGSEYICQIKSFVITLLKVSYI